MTTVHWWSARLDEADDERALSVVSHDEVRRAARFRLDRHRRQWLAGRAALRRGLGRVLDVDPRCIRLSERSGKAPRLDRPRDACSFSVARSGRLVVAACVAGRGIGIDLEAVVSHSDLDDIVGAHFAPDEQRAYLAAPPESRAELFYRLWTAKEAVLKARGVGFEPPLDEVWALAEGLRIERLAVAEGYDCTVAVEGAEWRLEEVDVG